MLSYTALINDATKLLFDSSDTPRIDAEILMQHVVGQPLSWLIAYGESIATAEHVKEFHILSESRLKGSPIAYLIGSRDFWTLTLKVDENVLIPRPDTETLVDAALDQLSLDSPLRILDLGTGSGAIALSLAKERPLAKVTAVDSQSGALALAKENAQLNKIDNVDFIVSDWFSNISPMTSPMQFDLIASNPPYIDASDPHLEQGDLRFEPSSALVAGGQGLADLATIIESAPGYLKLDGHLIVEHGYTQANEVGALFQDGGFSELRLFEDINGLPRCTLGRLTQKDEQLI